jgi:hypothetical protein
MDKKRHEVRVSSAGDHPANDGHTWRKYGQKEILGTKHPRCPLDTSMSYQKIFLFFSGLQSPISSARVLFASGIEINFLLLSHLHSCLAEKSCSLCFFCVLFVSVWLASTYSLSDGGTVIHRAISKSDW